MTRSGDLHVLVFCISLYGQWRYCSWHNCLHSSPFSFIWPRSFLLIAMLLETNFVLKYHMRLVRFFAPYWSRTLSNFFFYPRSQYTCGLDQVPTLKSLAWLLWWIRVCSNLGRGNDIHCSITNHSVRIWLERVSFPGDNMDMSWLTRKHKYIKHLSTEPIELFSESIVGVQQCLGRNWFKFFRKIIVYSMKME